MRRLLRFMAGGHFLILVIVLLMVLGVGFLTWSRRIPIIKPPAQALITAGVRSDRFVIELSNVPPEVRCFVMMNPNGHVYDGVTCIKREAKQ